MRNLNKIILENIELLLEKKNREGQAKDRCLDVIRNYFNDDEFLNQIYPNNSQQITYGEQYLKKFMDKFYHSPTYRSGQVMRIAPLICKLAFESNFCQRSPNAYAINRLSKILTILHKLSTSGEISLDKLPFLKFENFNNITFEEFDKNFGKMVDDYINEKRNRINNKTYTKNNEYKIIGPLDFKTAKKYGDKTCSELEICYTQNTSTWETYTNYGFNTVYVILKNGWENVPEEHTGNIPKNPYDDYGLSMIWVIVDENGDLETCNTRWNHNANYYDGYECDKALDEEDISNMLGVNFYSVFKSNGKFEKAVNKRLKAMSLGVSPELLFKIQDKIDDKGELAVVRFLYKYRILNLKTKTFTTNEWFDEVMLPQEDFYFTRVYIENKGYNFVDYNGKYLFKEWFKWILPFTSNGLAFVKYKKHNKYSIIDTKGRIIRENAYDEVVQSFKNGVAIVANFFSGDKKIFNLINSDGEPLIDSNYTIINVGYIAGSVVPVCIKEKNNSWNYVNLNGEFVFPFYFGHIKTNSEGFTSGYLKNEKGWVIINKDGLIIINKLFKQVSQFRNGIAKVTELDGSVNYIKNNGEMVSKYNFDEGDEYFKNNKVVVTKDNIKYILDTNGKLKKLNYFNKYFLREEDLNRIIKETIYDVLKEELQ